MQPGVHGAGIDQMRKGHLMNVTQPLVIGMRDQLEHQGVVDGDESVDRVVDDFSNGGGGRHNGKAGWAVGKNTKAGFKKLNLRLWHWHGSYG